MVRGEMFDTFDKRLPPAVPAKKTAAQREKDAADVQRLVDAMNAPAAEKE
jgi:hypothetical protein